MSLKSIKSPRMGCGCNSWAAGCGAFVGSAGPTGSFDRLPAIAGVFRDITGSLDIAGCCSSSSAITEEVAELEEIEGCRLSLFCVLLMDDFLPGTLSLAPFGLSFGIVGV